MNLVETNFDETVTVERYQGQSANGDIFEDPVEVEAEVQHERTWTRNADGDMVVSNTQLKVSPDIDEIPTQSKVTIDGEENRVINTRKPKDRLINEIHHMEIDLK